MILPFVREILAELEQSPAFDRVRRHLSLATGRRRVSGLTATARALYIPLFARAAKEPVIVVVPDNKAAEALELVLALFEFGGGVEEVDGESLGHGQRAFWRREAAEAYHGELCFGRAKSKKGKMWNWAVNNMYTLGADLCRMI